MNNAAETKKILIIEDNLFMAELISEKIYDEGLKGLIASSGADGIAMLEKEKPDLILLDLPLSGDIDGFETLSRIRASKDIRSLPVLILFANQDEAGIEKSRQLGANGYIVKTSTTTEEIISRVKQVLGLPFQEPENVPAVKEMSGKPVPKSEPVRKTPAQAGPLADVSDKLKAKIEKINNLPESDVSIITLIDDLTEFAFFARASDIHVEPFEDKIIARLRIDGILHDIFTFSKELHSGVITRIKVLAGLRTDEHQAAQDGRFRVNLQEAQRQFDIRVSIVPTYYGENAVLRLLAEQAQISSLDDLALSRADREKLDRAVEKPYGMILATGPTGSGKSTTLYTILKQLNSREISIITIEDPIEYSLEGVDQIQVNTRTGLTFATGLRSILRQDPNVIMVGEIRDEETANIAVNAALTGHKLLSTLHTNDAATTLPRLLDMGIEPFLVASTVNLALGQRLVRMICTHCKTKKRLTEAEFNNLARLIPPEVLDNNRDFYYGKGCPECGGSGYFDRAGIYEILEMNDFIREAIMRRADAGEVKKIAIKNGMTTLLEDGFRKAVAGLTTIEEILRVVNE